MKIKQYQVDAFARRVFEGNPAAVCPLDAWLSDEVMQAIAEENNLSETAFFVASPDGIQLRWFTPMAEVDLCGHATLASAHVIFEHLGYHKPVIQFATRSGNLFVQRNCDGMLSMDFPAATPKPCPAPPALLAGLGLDPVQVLEASDYLVVLESEAQVRNLAPDLARLAELDLRGVCVSAPGSDVDFVSRFFAPKVGIPEDPVTGSAHCMLAPYWSARLGKTSLTAFQASKRGGHVLCTVRGDRVILTGGAVTFLEGELDLAPR